MLAPAALTRRREAGSRKIGGSECGVPAARETLCACKPLREQAGTELSRPHARSVG
jgi:hypothetical protein